MNLLKHFVREIVETEQGVKSLDEVVVQFLIEVYAVKGKPRLRFTFDKLIDPSSSRGRVKTGGDAHVEYTDIGALYLGNTIYINDDAISAYPLQDRIMYVLHEIQHYNQEIKWRSDRKWRSNFIKNVKKLPSILYDDPLAIYDVDENNEPKITWGDITKFWAMRYGYDNSPDEIDAKLFASKNAPTAMKYVLEHFSDVVKQ